MKKLFLATLLASQIVSPAFAAKGDWVIRARAIDIAPQTSSSALNLDASDEWTPEVDFTYFLTDAFALELIADVPQKTTITANGASVGTLRLLPPTLTAQYHFLQNAHCNPYVGVGVNYTYFYDVNLSNGALTVDNNSWGAALQAGINFPINNHWSVNADVKKIWVSTDVIVARTGATAANFDVDPWVFGIGIGYTV